MQILEKYFPNLNDTQKKQFGKLGELYAEWNEQINIVSRKDIDNLYLHHVLHSLSIAKFIEFKKGAKVLDIGTGGGFPGIPLAILFPETAFHLVDSIGKKIKVVDAVSTSLKLKNVTSQHLRAEKVKGKYDFVVTRAVANINKLYNWTNAKVKEKSVHKLDNGLICLKGGDLQEEFEGFRHLHQIQEISNYFDEPFFETKKIVHIEI